LWPIRSSRRLASCCREPPLAAAAMFTGTRIFLAFTGRGSREFFRVHGTQFTRISPYVHGTRIARIFLPVHGTRISRRSPGRGSREFFTGSRDADHADLPLWSRDADRADLSTGSRDADLKAFTGARISRILQGSRDADHAGLPMFTGRGSHGSHNVKLTWGRSASRQR